MELINDVRELKGASARGMLDVEWHEWNELHGHTKTLDCSKQVTCRKSVSRWCRKGQEHYAYLLGSTIGCVWLTAKSGIRSSSLN